MADKSSGPGPLAAGGVFVASLLLVAAVFSACVPPPAQPQAAPPPQPVMKPLPTSTWGGRYRFQYQLGFKASAPGSVAVTMAVVNPHYRVAGSALGQRAYRKVGKGFSVSMGVDIQRILVAKGLKINGPFPSFSEMTYQAKKTSDLAIAPKVYIDVTEKPLGVPLKSGVRGQPGKPVYVGQYTPGQHWMLKMYVVVISGWITFFIHEPLSGVKLWIKRLELEEVKKVGVIAVKAIGQGTGGTQSQGLSSVQAGTDADWKPGEVLFDSRPDMVATVLKTYYATILGKLTTYVDIQEVLALQKKIKEIRERWRVGPSH